MIIACDHCGVFFERTQGDINSNAKRGRNNYCSQLCAHKGRGGTDTRVPIIRQLASRPCGTNAREVVRMTDMSTQCASDALQRRVEVDGYIRVKGRGTPDGHVSHQYFTLTEHALAWERMPPLKRPNVAIRINHHAKRIDRLPIQSKTWARTPMPGSKPKPAQVETHGLALGWDCRYQMAPKAAAEFVGEFQAEWKRLRGEK